MTEKTLSLKLRKSHLNPTMTNIYLTNSQTMKVQPNATEIEQALLGLLMTMPQTLDTATLNLNSEMFYQQRNAEIYRTIAALHRVGKRPDMLTVTQMLIDEKRIDEVGGIYYITQLTNVNYHGSIETWIAILKQKYARRKAIEIGYKLQEIGYDETVDELESYEVIDQQHKLLSDLLFGNVNVNTFAEVSQESLKELRQRIENAKHGSVSGIRTGFVDLDSATGGWDAGSLVVIAGRPGMGKTAIALHFAKVAAMMSKHVYLFSLEMTNTRLVDRIIIGETGTDAHKYRFGFIDESQFETIESWVRLHNTLPVYLDQKSFVTVDYIVNNARMRKRKNQLDLIVIDYLQLIDTNIERNGTKDQAIGYITRKLKALAVELNVPILLLSQLNRKVEERPNKRPSLHDLRESGNIEQDADVVMFTWRPDYYGIEEFEGENTKNLMILDIQKNRNGSSNFFIKLMHNDSITNFYDYVNDVEPF